MVPTDPGLWVVHAGTNDRAWGVGSPGGAGFIEARRQPHEGHGRTRWTGLPRMSTCQVVRSVLKVAVAEAPIV